MNVIREREGYKLIMRTVHCIQDDLLLLINEIEQGEKKETQVLVLEKEHAAELRKEIDRVWPHE